MQERVAMRVVVTGGGGYVGYHVGWALSRGGHHVTLLDLTPPDPEWADTAPRALWDVLPQASYGMSGREQLSPHAPQQEKVNIEGTREVIRAALTAKVRGLVYTSTYNVVFGGRQISGGDETLPLLPLHAHTDHYSRTKAIAEMLVLMADGKCGPPALPSPGPPHPCPAPPQDLLPQDEWGHGSGGEETHSPHHQRHQYYYPNAFLSLHRSGLLVLAYGRKDGLVDFIGIQNVVQAHVKALVALLKEQTSSPLVCGEAFFISDSAPVSYYEYFRPLFEGLGYSFPAFTLPLGVILAVAYLQAFTYCLVYKYLPFTPLVTPAEAYKSGVSHYCSNRKAARAFHYAPTRPNDLSQVVEYYRRQGCTKGHRTGLVSLLPLALFFILPVFVLLIVP
ncbi:Short-chain dehydrogenase/reductase family 42E member 1 [Chionoecetes opilio]|uniref:Short-chain dehydrogenase/reductase family 42E member 1 n=1 Tax=Chionoecetes opilio TaxID=41210 RepID=A0A8J5CKZ8_CHIOP|nr:Short-chain dehydrogenase/reductase family 42E member 1 [Chionoecetes opilio]